MMNMGLVSAAQSSLLQPTTSAAEVVGALKKGKDLLAVQEQVRQCLIGYTKYDILNGAKPLQFIKYNYQSLNITEGNQIFQSMMHKGIQ